jgi:hypothetical protein
MTLPAAPPVPLQQKEAALSSELVSEVKRRLWEETAQGLGNVVGNLREAWYTGSDAVFYSREEERLNKYIPPFRYGLVASVFLFVNFRVTGNPRFQDWRKGIWKRIRPTTPPKKAPPTPSTPLKPPPTGGYLETKRRTDVEKALKSMKLLTDFLISLTVGTSGTLFLLEANCGKDIRPDYESAPLVAGRSLVAEEMCPGMLELHRSDSAVRRALDGHAKDDSVEGQRKSESRSSDPNLATFATFVKNCQKRADHEARLRHERHGVRSGNNRVLIPHTGVR